MSRMVRTGLLLLGTGLGLCLAPLGCAAVEGDDQNYKINQEERDLFETRPPGDSDVGADASPRNVPGPNAVASADDSGVIVVQDESGEPIVIERVEPTMVTAQNTSMQSTEAIEMESVEVSYATGPAPLEHSQPSVTGINRDNWNRIRVAPESISVKHQPIWFSDLPRKKPARTQLDFDDPLKQQMVNVLSGARKASGFGDGNAVELATQPGKAIVDLVLFPYNALAKPIWTTEESPR